MKPRVFVETSVLSDLTALPSGDIVRAAHQQMTLEWWAQRDRFELFVSEMVLAEAGRGDPTAAGRRLAAAEGLQVHSASVEAQALAAALLRSAAMPPKAAVDAAHVAIATAHGLEFVLTWYCAHLANAVTRPRIEAACRRAGFQPPVICTPEELTTQEEQ
ncbi:type II toxin-antitoxin system VapC family toxin [Myxococcota bacterium]|nr:type II toxin-antitoxin system VapC family toxin [Myxococcota bacterium]